MGEGAADAAQELAEIGVDRAIVPSFLFLGDTEASLAAYAEQGDRRPELSAAARPGPRASRSTSGTGTFVQPSVSTAT